MAVSHKTQRDERRDIIADDQFGRQWHMNIEIKTGDPTCLASPVGFTDPLNTPTSMMTVPKRFGQPQWGKVEVDLRKWITQQENEEHNWKLNLFNIAQDTYKGKFDPKEIENDEYVMHQAGPKPWPPVAVLERLKRGKLDDALTKEFLGLTPPTKAGRMALNRPTLEDFYEMAPDSGEEIPSTYKEFVAFVMKKGKAKDISGAAELWRAHKAALQSA